MSGIFLRSPKTSLGYLLSEKLIVYFKVFRAIYNNFQLINQAQKTAEINYVQVQKQRQAI